MCRLITALYKKYAPHKTLNSLGACYSDNFSVHSNASKPALRI